MDLLGVAHQLHEADRTRLEQVREFLQTRIRRQSIEFWNREEFPAGLVQELADAGLAGVQLDGSSHLLRGLLHAEIARADVSLSSI
ncbi:acyl-CoA dehydrogenase family protein, partial [Glutamicibacter sp. 287]